MPEFQLTDSIITSLNAQEPWPDNVKLFQPYEVEQILLPDNASCLAVQAFLKMCNLPFEVEMRWNSEFMSPSGRVPFIKCGAFVVSELEPIVQFAANKGVSLCGKLSSEEKAEMRAYMSLITNVLVNAELYISWIDDETYNTVTKVRNSSVYPWPLGWLQTRSKRTAVAKRLRALHWGDKTLEQVLADVEQCCNSLSQRLGDRDYFFGSTPTPLDALVYGHTRALLSANGPKAGLMIKPMSSTLLRHVVKMVNCTGMVLTSQEEYLLTQAFQVTRRRISPTRSVSDRSTRTKRSRLCTRNTSRDTLAFKRSDIFGFKPFASKKIIIIPSKEGILTCKYSEPYKNMNYEEDYNFASEILEDIIDKVEEVAFFNIIGSDDEKNDFEMVYQTDDKVGSVTVKMNEYLDTIEENDTTDTTVSPDIVDNLIQIIQDDMEVNESTGLVGDSEAVTGDSVGITGDSEGILDDSEGIMGDSEGIMGDSEGVIGDSEGIIDDSQCNNVDSLGNVDDSQENLDGSQEIIDECQDTLDDSIGNHGDTVMVEDSDGIVNDKLLEFAMNDAKDNVDSEFTDSSFTQAMKIGDLTFSSSGDRFPSDKTEKTDCPRTPDSSGSQSTLKMPSDEDISVECLLKYLRARNEASRIYGSQSSNLEIADID